MALVTHRLDRCAVDSFRRVMSFFWAVAFVLVAAASCQRANAETIGATNESYAATLTSQWQVCNNTACGSVGDYVSACQSAAPAFVDAYGPPSNDYIYAGVTGTSSSPSACQFTKVSIGAIRSIYNWTAHGTVYTCPTGGTLSGTTCLKYTCPITGGWTLSGTECTRSDCPSGQTPNESGQCNCPPAGTPIGGSVYGLAGKHTSGTFCAGTCELSAGGGRTSGQSPNGDWFTEWYGPFTTTGVSNCVQSSGQTGPEDAPRCPVDQCMGEVNGVQVCVACTNRDSDPPPRSRETDNTQPGQPGTRSSETTTSHTECTSTGCTTTTTTTTTEQDYDANGDPTGTPRTTITTETEPGDGTEMGEFCENNPTSPLCAKSSFGGACGGFTCDGDAVQCAIVQEQHKRNCELLTDSGDLSRVGAVAAFNSHAAEFDKSTLTTTTPLDSISGQTLYASALADQSYTVRGQVITIPFSSLVDYLSYAGIAFMIVCGMVSVRIFSTVLG